MKWQAARNLALVGKSIRRAAWNDRWLSYTTGIWWITPFDSVSRNSGVTRVVRSTDWTPAAFSATDWTTDEIPTVETGATAPNLVHRWSFQGDATDSIGGVTANLIGNAHVVDGSLTMSNLGLRSDAPAISYLDFGQRVIPASGSVTIEVWFTSADMTTPMQRLFDFSNPAGTQAATHFFLTPYSVPSTQPHYSTPAGPRATIGLAALTANDAAGFAWTPDSNRHMLAVVLTPRLMRIFFDGVEGVPSQTLYPQNVLENLNCVNNWIGRSTYTGFDPGFTGQIHEFRIYDTERTSELVAASFTAGPDTVV